jgi:hypothetical protein
MASVIQERRSVRVTITVGPSRPARGACGARSGQGSELPGGVRGHLVFERLILWKVRVVSFTFWGSLGV